MQTPTDSGENILLRYVVFKNLNYAKQPIFHEGFYYIYLYNLFMFNSFLIQKDKILLL